MITYQLWYRKYGIRLDSQLAMPPVFELNEIDFPMKSIYHYITSDGVENGPPSDDYFFRNIKKPIFVGHIEELGAQLGTPHKQAINTAVMVRDYHNHHRRMKQMRNVILACKDPNTLVVFNYCLINKTYKYVRSIFTEYYKWYNTFASVVDNIAKVSQETDSQHFILSGAPKIIPSLSQLETASEKEMNQSLLKIINSKEGYILVELWKWLGDNPSSSLFGRIPNNRIHLVNIIYQESGKWATLNLGVLNSFRKQLNTDTNDFVIKSKSTLDNKQVQKRLLKMIMVIMEIRTSTANVIIDPEEKPEVSILTGNVIDEDIPNDDDQILEDGSMDDDVKVPTAETSDTDSSEIVPAEEVQIISDDEDLTSEESEEIKQKKIKEEDDQLDRDLAYLNEIASKHEQEENTENTTSVKEILDQPEVSLEDSVMQICDKLADDGLLTAGEYRRFTRLANSYKEIISPDGKTPLSEFIKIDPAVLKIVESPNMVDNDTILDKTMLKSSLIDFDSKYVENVLSKDTAGMVMSLQKAGVAVTNYKVEKVRDILGGYEMHILKIAPVEGLPSTLKFKLPIIEKNGSFVSNNVRYTLRKQRGD